MNNGLIAIMDYEEAYTVKLADFFRAKSGINYDVYVFTNIHSFLEFNKNNFTDILIISEIYGDYIADFINVGQIYILSEGSINISLADFSCIYKYQSAENIIREIMTGYCALNIPPSRISLKATDAVIRSIYSPVKRCGKTTFALVLGCLLAKNESSLFISLEEYSYISLYTEASYSDDLSDLLYFYGQSPYNLDKKLLSMSHSLHQLDFIPPMRFSLDLKYLSGEDWAKFIHDIISIGKYKNIILDISDCIIDIFKLLSISDIIYFPVLDDDISKGKIDRFKETVRHMKLDSILNNLKEIKLPLPDMLSGDNMFTGLLYGSYGSWVSKLINEYGK